MHNNSISVYKEKILPNIKARHHKVMDALNVLGEACSLEVADYLNVPLNAISGRFTELSGTKEYGRPIIEQVGSKKNRYGNTSAIWKIKTYMEPLKQGAIF